MKLIYQHKGFVELRVPIYRMRIFVVPTNEELPEVFEECNTEEIESDNRGFRALCQLIEGPSGAEAILLRLPKRWDESVVAHECIHAAHFILNSRGVEADMDNDEAITYLVEMLLHLIRVGFYKKKGDKFYG